jgi:hypothetical protein
MSKTKWGGARPGTGPKRRIFRLTVGQLLQVVEHNADAAPTVYPVEVAGVAPGAVYLRATDGERVGQITTLMLVTQPGEE